MYPNRIFDWPWFLNEKELIWRSLIIIHSVESRQLSFPGKAFISKCNSPCGEKGWLRACSLILATLALIGTLPAFLGLTTRASLRSTFSSSFLTFNVHHHLVAKSFIPRSIAWICFWDWSAVKSWVVYQCSLDMTTCLMSPTSTLAAHSNELPLL